MKMARHSEWRQTNHYTDPSSVPLLAGMEKLSDYLPASGVSLNSGKRGQNAGEPAQTDPVKAPAEIVANDDGRGSLSKHVTRSQYQALASPRGFEPRLSP